MSKSLRPPRRSLTVVAHRPAAGTPGRYVLAVGRITPARCFNCEGFESVSIRRGGQLVTVSCPVCSPSARVQLAG